MQISHSIKDLKIIKQIPRVLKKIAKTNKSFINVIVKKPWGSEFLAHQDKDLAMWILNIKHNHRTSFHCHMKKKTILYVLKGSILFRSMQIKKKRINAGNYVSIEKKTFHQTQAIGKEKCCVLEIETPVDKEDLLRFRDDYNREKLGYEKKFKAVTPKKINILKKKYLLFLKKPEEYKKILCKHCILLKDLQINKKKYKKGSILKFKLLKEIASDKIALIKT